MFGFKKQGATATQVQPSSTGDGNFSPIKEVHNLSDRVIPYPGFNLNSSKERLITDSPVPRVVDKRPASFRVLDLRAVMAFKTSGSISYNLDKEKSGEPPRRIGWIDIHHPCEGPIRSQVRVVITQEYFDSNAMNTIVRTALNAIEVPPDGRFEAEFVFQPAPVV